MAASKDIDSLFKVMSQELSDIAEFILHANRVQTRARTRYYKAAYYTSAQVVELLVYMIVLRSCEKRPELLDDFKTKLDVKLHELPASKLGSGKRLHIIETVNGPSTLEDVWKDLQKMIVFCRSQKLISAHLYKRLERIRAKRNEIHLHLRTSHSRHYTKAHIDQLADTTIELFMIFLKL